MHPQIPGYKSIMPDNKKVEFQAGLMEFSSFPRKIVGFYQGLMHSVAETVMLNMIDLDGKKFPARFMLDTGGMMSIISAQCINPDGRWHEEDISHNPLKISGVFEGVENMSRKWMKVRLEPIDGANMTEVENPLMIVDVYVMNDIATELPGSKERTSN